VRDQHPYKTTGKIMVSYILILKFLERRQEDDYEAFPENNLLLISL
jgi:hypothetical protein